MLTKILKGSLIGDVSNFIFLSEDWNPKVDETLTSLWYRGEFSQTNKYGHYLANNPHKNEVINVHPEDQPIDIRFLDGKRSFIDKGALFMWNTCYSHVRDCNAGVLIAEKFIENGIQFAIYNSVDHIWDVMESK